MKKVAITVEGNIGSGKSTLTKNLEAHGFDCHRQNIEALDQDIKNFYVDRKKYCYALQHGFQLKYAEAYKKCKVGNKNYVIEGILSTFNVFTVANYIEQNLTCDQFTSLFKQYSENQLPKLEDFDLVVYLYCSDLNVILERIKERKQIEGEQKIDFGYLKHISDGYDFYLKDAKNVVRIDNTNLSAAQTMDLVVKELRERNLIQ